MYNSGQLQQRTFNSVLIWNGKSSFDITDTVQELSYYESIFNNCIHGQLIITDTGNMIEQMDIHGNEYVAFSIVGKDGVIHEPMVFDVYSIKNVRNTNSGTKSISIMLSSGVKMRNENFKLSRFYEGSSSDIISDITQNMLKIDPSRINIDPIGNSISYVVPRLSPLKAINYISSVSHDPSTNSSAFFFFENNRGFKWTSVRGMFSKQPTDSLNWNTDSGDLRTTKTNKILSWRVENLFDKIDLIQGGTFGSTAISHDIKSKTLTIDTFNYIDKQYTLNSKSIYVNPEYSNNAQYVVQSKNILNDEHTDAELLKLYQKSEMSSYGLVVELYSNTKIAAGDVVLVDIPSSKSGVTVASEPDRALSGKYLVTKLKHSLTKSDYKIIAKLNKESTV